MFAVLNSKKFQRIFLNRQVKSKKDKGPPSIL